MSRVLVAVDTQVRGVFLGGSDEYDAIADVTAEFLDACDEVGTTFDSTVEMEEYDFDNNDNLFEDCEAYKNAVAVAQEVSDAVDEVLGSKPETEPVGATDDIGNAGEDEDTHECENPLLGMLRHIENHPCAKRSRKENIGQAIAELVNEAISLGIQMEQIIAEVSGDDTDDEQ